MYRYFYHVNDPDSQLCYPHYSDPTFDAPGGVVIYGRESKSLSWEYDDRLKEWHGYDKAHTIVKQLQEEGYNLRTARGIQEYISRLIGKSISLECIIAGTRMDNGYTWYCYGYKVLDAQ